MRHKYFLKLIEIEEVESLAVFLASANSENYSKRTLVSNYSQNIQELSKEINDVLHSDNDFILIAVSHDKIVGVLDFYDSTCESDLLPLAELGVTVLADFQNKGIGTSLMKMAQDKASVDASIKQIMLSVDSKNIPAINIYKKLGYEIHDTLIKKTKTTFEMILKI